MQKLPRYKLQIEHRKGYLYVEYGGDGLILDDFLNIINTVAAAIRAGRVERVLVARNAPLLASDDNRELIASIIRRVVPPGVRFAIVDIFGNKPEAAKKAAEVAAAAGWDLTHFDTIEEAAAWLTSAASAE